MLGKSKVFFFSSTGAVLKEIRSRVIMRATTKTMKSMQNSHNLLIQEQLGKSKISFGFAYITFFLLIE